MFSNRLQLIRYILTFQILYQMINEGLLLNGNQKNSSAEVNISTSESVHLINQNRQVDSRQSHQKRCLPLLELRQLEQPSRQSKYSKQENEVSSRLFTFMDQKEAERKIIQDYILKNAYKGQKDSDSGQQTKEGKQKGGIVRMIEDSKKKRDDFLKKLYKNGSLLKENMSVSKLNRISRSKTPKHINIVHNKYETLLPRSRSKTPKLDPFKSNTPKTQRQIQLFRANSNVGKEGLKHHHLKDRQQEKESIVAKRTIQVEQDTLGCRQSLNQKELLKKKKELQRQLTLVNESLLVLKKVDNGKKKGKGGACGKGGRKKSVSRLGRV